jgi:hypothetical protein
VGNWSPNQNISMTITEEVNSLLLFGEPKILFPGGGREAPVDTYIDMTNITLNIVTLIVSSVVR